MADRFEIRPTWAEIAEVAEHFRLNPAVIQAKLDRGISSVLEFRAKQAQMTVEKENAVRMGRAQAARAETLRENARNMAEIQRIYDEQMAQKRREAELIMGGRRLGRTPVPFADMPEAIAGLMGREAAERHRQEVERLLGVPSTVAPPQRAPDMGMDAMRRAYEELAGNNQRPQRPMPREDRLDTSRYLSAHEVDNNAKQSNP